MIISHLGGWGWRTMVSKVAWAYAERPCLWKQQQNNKQKCLNQKHKQVVIKEKKERPWLLRKDKGCRASLATSRSRCTHGSRGNCHIQTGSVITGPLPSLSNKEQLRQATDRHISKCLTWPLSSTQGLWSFFWLFQKGTKCYYLQGASKLCLNPELYWDSSIDIL